MRNKKSAAIAVKFSPHSGRDQITNMEGAMHSFLTPIIPRCEMVGDYVFNGGHFVTYFGQHNKRLVRKVVLSASIQPDFENSEVMLVVCALGEKEVVGRDLFLDPKWEILSPAKKQDKTERARYDAGLRAHMVFHLTHAHKLPAKKDVRDQDIVSYDSAIGYLNDIIKYKKDIRHAFRGLFLKLKTGELLSLELLYNAAVEQARNEFSGLEALCPKGYVYTFDPASIFAGNIGARILNRIMLCALKTLSEHNKFKNMRVFAFNDYAEPGIMPFVRTALAEQDSRVMKKAELFLGKDGTYEVGEHKECKGAMLVLHNNSDGFGQNIETEGIGGSMDGAIGASSSAAASLERTRKDLLDFVC